MLNSIISSTASSITIKTFLICSLASIILGLASAFLHRVKNQPSKSFTVTLALLPIMVQTVIMMVNGNLGAGIAVAGAFSLVRFRSAPGSARDILSIFFSMAIGLATGTGYIAVACILTLLVAILTIVYNCTSFGELPKRHRFLKITMPEDVNYETALNDVFDKYTDNRKLTKVKTSHMGSLFNLTYTVTLKENINEKEFIDALRCRNGNLDIVCTRETVDSQL